MVLRMRHQAEHVAVRITNADHVRDRAIRIVGMTKLGKIHIEAERHQPAGFDRPRPCEVLSLTCSMAQRRVENSQTDGYDCAETTRALTRCLKDRCVVGAAFEHAI